MIPISQLPELEEDLDPEAVVAAVQDGTTYKVPVRELGTRIVTVKAFLPSIVFDGFTRSGLVFTASAPGQLWAEGVPLQQGDKIVTDHAWTEQRRPLGVVTEPGGISTPAVITLEDSPSDDDEFPIYIHVRDRGTLLTWRGNTTALDSRQWLLLPDWSEAAPGAVLTIVDDELGRFPRWVDPIS